MPAPKTTQVAPASTFAVFMAAPRPVESPQAKRQACSGGASGLTFARAISGITVYSANVDVPMKWRIGSLPPPGRGGPSGGDPLPRLSPNARPRVGGALGAGKASRAWG